MLNVLSSRLLLRPCDFDVSVRFYEETLGLTRSREFGTPPHRGIVFFLGGAELELSETPGAAAQEAGVEGVRLWLRVPDAHAACDAVAARGATVQAAPTMQPWGLLEGRISDPDGLELVIVEVPADHPLRRDPRSVREAGQ